MQHPSLVLFHPSGPDPPPKVFPSQPRGTVSPESCPGSGLGASSQLDMPETPHLDVEAILSDPSERSTSISTTKPIHPQLHTQLQTAPPGDTEATKLSWKPCTAWTNKEDLSIKSGPELCERPAWWSPTGLHRFVLIRSLFFCPS